MKSEKKNGHMTVFYKTEGSVIVGFCMKFAGGTLRINLLLGLRMEWLQHYR